MPVCLLVCLSVTLKGTKGATISKPGRPQMVDGAMAPRYNSRPKLITLADQLAIALEDEVEQAGAATVLSLYLLNPVRCLAN